MQPPSRRTLLALGLLLLATACTGGHGGNGAAPGDRGTAPNPDEPVILRAVAATDTLLTGYDTLLATPAGAVDKDLAALRAEVVRHRAALAHDLPAASVPPAPGAAPATSGSASTAPGPTATPTATAVGTPAALAALERQTARTRLADLAAARPPLARILASIATSDVLHAVALGDNTPLVTPPPAPTAAPTGTPSGPAAPGDAEPSGSPSPAAPAATATTPAATAPPGAVAALQGALGAEHAAVYGYGVVGARLPDDQQRADARTAYAAHEARRDAWQRLVGSLGATPSAAAAGYQLPFAVTDAAAAGRLAAHLETRLTTVYADLVSAVPGPERTAAADALRECALRAHRWGAPDQAFPGIPDTPPGPSPSAPASASAPATAGSTG
ncbi:ferritin-like domain-containing protein [Kitasatospora sp. NPDC101176]|uniref:ferritin-like domain-containing protein n=1 Tax=Kitasatospora sp. NPDC101176 TaxID=3364099 RepID=UPI00382F944A